MLARCKTASARTANKALCLHDDFAAQEHGARPARHRQTLVRRPAGRLVKGSCGEYLFALGVKNDHIGIVARGKAPFARQAHPARGVGATDLHPTRQAQPTLVDAKVMDKREPCFDAGHAARDLGEVAAFLFSQGPRAMVGADDLELVLGQGRPQRVLVFQVAPGWGANLAGPLGTAQVFFGIQE